MFAQIISSNMLWHFPPKIFFHKLQWWNDQYLSCFYFIRNQQKPLESSWEKQTLFRQSQALLVTCKPFRVATVTRKCLCFAANHKFLFGRAVVSLLHGHKMQISKMSSVKKITMDWYRQGLCNFLSSFKFILWCMMWYLYILTRLFTVKWWHVKENILCGMYV